MSEVKEKSIIIDEGGIPKYKVVIVEYWELLQGVETILFILSLVIVPPESREHWKLWIAHILISVYIFYKRGLIERKN